MVKFPAAAETNLGEPSPAPPELGSQRGYVAGTISLKPATVARPPPVLTASFPEWAPFGMVATILVAAGTVKVALTPPNFTHCVPPRFAPRIVTFWPTFAFSGRKLVIRGFGSATGLW